ncbi:RicAFT regulatory complex protein RicA family protein [Halalkalibacterium halodurans]|uniref:BH2371 protein n=1 Tax=Halalkalibacterium halodurans (strain ATCC BAA-125 / DSM 18197 / FERM 7344 / JCM 9153 / C-125) TaxID=272558 RepID=Q9KAB8_HALH5|nr:RicAFT regulatory complex protein RicA family protein [Halalkalibacterium halodurans]MED4126198.1 RicAFT regulatory complex protein RicA family protein [Halalkalibacterium halodurans]MED4171879.1 RicAFT regulatory complex protein RicA family protein [Halalkalibacterium halodurans]BAB06090.1 BH2371 [Halalkalibacterium halodurans C-125]
MTAKYTRDDIKQRARELALMIAETEEVDFFKRAEKQINEHLRVQEIIAEIKKYQKEAVNLQHYGKKEALKEVEAKIDELQNEIDAIPLVQEFKQSQMDVNELLQLVSMTISKTVTDHIITSMGGDLLRGTTTKNPLIDDGCGKEKC